MKKPVRLTAAALALGLMLCVPGAKAETSLKLNMVGPPDSFVAAHPDVVITNEHHYYENTGEMITEMLLGTFDSDVFAISSFFDYRSIMEKGYCLDLSGSEIIRNAIENLYPVYADQCVMDGRIYAVPTGGQLEYMAINTDRLAESGMGDVEIPDTFPEFLDFVEAWNEHLQEDPGDIALCGSMFWVDEADFNRIGGYTYYLVEYLLDNHILQKSFAGEPLRFNEPEVVELLKRCYELGRELDLNDPSWTANKALLEHCSLRFLSGDNSAFVSLRLNEDQPKLIKAFLELVAVNARTAHPDLCIEMLESMVQYKDLTVGDGHDSGDELAQTMRTFLYQNVGLAPSKRHDENVATSQRFLDQVKKALANENLSATDRYDLDEELKWREEDLQAAIETEDGKWVVPPDRLEFYKSLVDTYYVPMPGVFSPTEAEQAKTFEQLKSRFVAGQMTAEELVAELDRVAEMIERESE